MKRKPHLISEEDLQEWVSQEEVLYASSGYESKNLHCTLGGVFIVRTPFVEHYKGSDLSMAVAVYNAITDKYVPPKIDWKL